ncbi:YbjN domain-containing protein [Sphingomonas panni]|uniref:YbjN domain-containing protein n=1 Tax=Sphingomonas panni TaxID=237612 RepID=UPI001F5BA4B5|nr:YbjN domain-containing protein [Sphingomonas panni]
MNAWGKLAIGVAAMVASVPAAAQTVQGTEPETIMTALREAGYRAALSKDNVGDPVIKSGAAGVDFSVLFYNCTEHKDCKTIQFYAGFVKKGRSLDTMNKWNAEHRFGRAYLDDEKDPRIEMDLDLDKGGMSSALFKANIATWESLLGDFQKAIDF